jgi:hypothetical protein
MPSEFKCGILLFSGKKHFKNLNMSIKVYIVNHPHFSCLELISVPDESNHKELNRVYLNSKLLARKINHNISDSFSMNSIINDMITTMIFDRMDMIKVGHDRDESFEMFLNPIDGDIVVNDTKDGIFVIRLDFQHPQKPDGVIPFKGWQSFAMSNSVCSHIYPAIDQTTVIPYQPRKELLCVTQTSGICLPVEMPPLHRRYVKFSVQSVNLLIAVLNRFQIPSCLFPQQQPTELTHCSCSWSKLGPFMRRFKPSHCASTTTIDQESFAFQSVS